MTDTVEVTGLQRVANPKPNRGGSTVIAYFECEARGLRFAGCALVRTPKNGLVAWLPKLENPDGQRRFVTFTDDSLRHAMMLNAREAYRAMGGTDAEWIGSSVPMGPRPTAEPIDETAGLNTFLANDGRA